MKMEKELINKIDSDLERNIFFGNYLEAELRKELLGWEAMAEKNKVGKTPYVDDTGHIVWAEPFDCENAYHIKGINDNGRFYYRWMQKEDFEKKYRSIDEETKAKGECVFEDVHIKQGDATKEEEGFKIVRNADSELRSKFIELPVLFKNYDDREKIAELIGEKPEDTYIKKVGSFKKASIRAFNPSFHCDRETTTLYLDSDECCYIVDMSYEEFKKEVQPKLKRSWE